MLRSMRRMARLPLTLRALLLVPLLAAGVDLARATLACGPRAESCLETAGQGWLGAAGSVLLVLYAGGLAFAVSGLARGRSAGPGSPGFLRLWLIGTVGVAAVCGGQALLAGALGDGSALGGGWPELLAFCAVAGALLGARAADRPRRRGARTLAAAGRSPGARPGRAGKPRRRVPRVPPRRPLRARHARARAACSARLTAAPRAVSHPPAPPFPAARSVHVEQEFPMSIHPTKRVLREQRRADRIAAERAEAAAGARRTRAFRLLAAAGVAAVLVAVAAVVSSPGGQAAPPAASSSLFRGIPERAGVLGDPRAPLTVTEYVDLQCPVCAAAARETLPSLVRDYVRTGKAKLEARTLHFIGPDSERAARVAAGAERQGRLWPFLEAFYAAQGQENSGYVTDGFLRSVATTAGVDADAALKFADGAAAQQRLNRADADAQRLGDRRDADFHARARGREAARARRAIARRGAGRGARAMSARAACGGRRARRPRDRGLPHGRALLRRHAGLRRVARLRDGAAVRLRRARRRPVALLGLAGYVAILGSLARDGEAARTVTAFLALAGFGFSGWLTYVEVARLDAICSWCVGSAVCMTLLAALSVTRVLRAPPPGRRA